MRILSWNLNGLKASVNRGDFRQLKKLYPIDVICLQEIRTKEKMEVIEGYHHYWYAAEQRRYSGTLLMCLEKPKRLIYGIGVPDLDTEGRVLTAEFDNVYVVNTYAPNSQHDVDRKIYRMKWDAAYYEFLLALSSTKPVIACGDFNATLSRLDVYDENERADYAELGYESDERSNLKDIIENLNFTDAFRHLYPDKKGEYTWWSLRKNRRDADRGWRLDFFLVSEHLRDCIKEVEHRKDIKGSDHCPILLTCDVPVIPKDEGIENPRQKRKEHDEENNALSTRWAKKQKEFDKYKVKLAEIQADISLNEQMHNHEEVRRLQQSIMDDIRFRCLAVDKAAHTRGVSGVDNIKWETDADKMQAAIDLEWRNYEASPMRLIEIKTKQTGKVRRAGILTRRDKAMSILCSYTFQPVEEAHADRGSFAFRPGRSRQDAIAAIKHLFLGDNPPEIYVYIDVRGFYANIQHKWIMSYVPIMKDVLYALLKAGHIFAGELFPSGEYGISEGSPLSPSIANFTLDGMQQAIYLGLYGTMKDIDYDNGAMVRFADDVLVAVRTFDDAERVLESVRKFLEPRGLIISEEKTTVGNIRKGLTVIGYHLIKEHGEIIVTPSEEAINRFIESIHEYILLHNRSQRRLIEKLNQKLTGWATQYRNCEALEAYKEIDAAVNTTLLEVLRTKHPKAQVTKLIAQYWYTDTNGNMWYSMQSDRTVRVVHLKDTLLIASKRARTDMNPYYMRNYFKEKKREEDIDHVNAKFRPVWERYNGKCLYCGRDIHPSQEKRIVPVDHTVKQTLANSAYIHSACAESDYQYFMTTESVDGATEYDLREMIDKISDGGIFVKPPKIKDTWKYLKIYEYFGTCTKKHFSLSFKEIEDILGFPLTDNQKSTRNVWYAKTKHKTIANAWEMQGYKMLRVNIEKKRVYFERRYDDMEMVVIPPEIADRKIPKKAKRELEHFMQTIIDKYALTDEAIIPKRKIKPKFEEYKEMYLNGEISGHVAAKALNMPPASFYYRVKHGPSVS